MFYHQNRHGSAFRNFASRTEAMEVAAGVVACALPGDSAPANTPAYLNIDVSSSSESDSDADAVEREDEADSDDNFGADTLPSDHESLEHELARLDELEKRLEKNTAPDLLMGYELLRLARQERVDRAHAALLRRQLAAQKVLEYAEEKAHETYSGRCAELQREMNADFERELRRLQTAKDGVSVTSRRRRAVRDESGGFGFSTPAKSPSNGMRRRRAIDGEDGRPEDVFLASASPEERAHRVQFQEKKRLEKLLGRASVFKPVVKQVTPAEVADDLQAIRSAVPGTEEGEESSGHRTHKTKQKRQPKKKQPKKKMKRQRPMVITPRRIPHAPGPNVPASATPRTAASRRPRLQHNPRMLQEGQEVQVFKRRRPDEESGDVDGSQDVCVMSGIITAATATQVYVLTASGRFESFDVRDCAVGSLYVRDAERGSLTNALR
jgi:hypothetical protein